MAEQISDRAIIKIFYNDLHKDIMPHTHTHTSANEGYGKFSFYYIGYGLYFHPT